MDFFQRQVLDGPSAFLQQTDAVCCVSSFAHWSCVLCLHAQAVCQTDQISLHWLPGRNYGVALALQFHIAKVPHAGVLQALRKLRIAQSSLTQLDVELGAEQTLDI